MGLPKTQTVTYYRTKTKCRFGSDCDLCCSIFSLISTSWNPQMLRRNRQKHAYRVLLYRSFQLPLNVWVEQTNTCKDKAKECKPCCTSQARDVIDIVTNYDVHENHSCVCLISSPVLTHITTLSSYYILTCPMMPYRLCSTCKHVSHNTKNQRESLGFYTRPIFTP